MALCVITGAATGIGRELARICARDGHKLLLVDRDREVSDVGAELSEDVLLADLATQDGVEELAAHLEDTEVDLLFLNAGRGLGRAFMDQDPAEILDVMQTNVIGSVMTARMLGKRMVARGEGRILFTGSIAGFMPGTYQAAYNASKAFINSFSIALAHELRDSGVTVTCLMPGPTDTDFFERADMLDTPVGQQKKDDPAKVAEAGYKAMLAGREQVTYGLMNKVQATAAEILPAGVSAEMHRKMAKPQDE